ncbi:MAG: WYL domain-containing protein, partial [candidate division NC10 bacterium]|nr:WYL domain-containing protein [candidate division NC10 bacterium]
HLRQRVLTFSLGRIRAARPTPETFLLPEGFNFQEYVKESFASLRAEPVRVQVLFSAHQAPWIAERLWHPSQKMQYQLDGSLLMSLEVTDSLELKRWILGFGQEAEVLEPRELREAIRQEAEGLMEKYAGAGRGRRKARTRAAADEAGPLEGKLAIEIV